MTFRIFYARSLLGLLIALISAQYSLAIPNDRADGMSPAALVRAVVANEVKAANTSASEHMYCSQKRTPHSQQTKLYIETRDAMAGMTVANDGKPLSAQELRGETDHLDGIVNSPDQLRKKRAHEKQDADRSLRIVKALPDAFLYERDGTEDGAANLGRAGDQLVRLKFRPNPAYSPPSHEEQVLTAMRGYLLIDIDELRLAKIDGTLFKEINFGWGIAGRLDAGGHFIVQQADVGDGSWEMTRMTLNFTGKILMVKSLSIVSDEVFSNFRRVPDNITFAAAVKMLKEEQTKWARNSTSWPQVDHQASNSLRR